MLHFLSVWLLVAAFFGAGVFNAIGTPSTKGSFVRWGHPDWWCRLTGGLEIVAAVLVALPGSPEAGLILGAVIVAAAVLTVLRHREFSHLAPLRRLGRAGGDLILSRGQPKPSFASIDSNAGPWP